MDLTVLEPVELTPVNDRAMPQARRLVLTELTERTCKWPVGDPLKEDFHSAVQKPAMALPTASTTHAWHISRDRASQGCQCGCTRLTFKPKNLEETGRVPVFFVPWDRLDLGLPQKSPACARLFH